MPTTYILETPITLDDGLLTREDLNRNDLEAHFAIDNFAWANVQVNYESDVNDSQVAPVFYDANWNQVTDASTLVTPSESDQISLTTPQSLNPSLTLVQSSAASSLANYQSGWGQQITAANTTSGEEMWTKASYAAFFNYTTTSRAYSNFGAREMFGPTYFSDNNLGATELILKIRNIIAGIDFQGDSSNNSDLRLLLINGIRDQWRAANPTAEFTSTTNILQNGDRLTFIFYKQISHASSQTIQGVTTFDPNVLLLKSMVTVTVSDTPTTSILVDVIDGYIANAHVIVRNPVTFDVLIDTFSNAQGQIEIPANSGEVIIEASGGTDISINESFSSELSAMLDTQESSTAVITPLTTLAFESIREELETAAENPESRLSLSALKDRRRTAFQETAADLGLAVEDMKSNFLEDASKTDVAKVATLIASTQKLITASVRTAKNGNNSEDSSIARKVMRNLSRKMKEMKTTIGTGAQTLMENTELLKGVATSTLIQDGLNVATFDSQLDVMAQNVRQMNKAVNRTTNLNSLVKLNGVSSKKAKNEASTLLASSFSETDYETESNEVVIGQINTRVAPDPVTFQFTLVGLNVTTVNANSVLIQTALANVLSLNINQVELTNTITNTNNASNTDITATLTVYIAKGLDNLQANLLAFSSNQMVTALQALGLDVAGVSVLFTPPIQVSIGAVARFSNISVEDSQNTHGLIFKTAMASIAGVDLSNVTHTAVKRADKVELRYVVSYSNFDAALSASDNLSTKTLTEFRQAYRSADTTTAIIDTVDVSEFTPPNEPLIVTVVSTGMSESTFLNNKASILKAFSNRTSIDVGQIQVTGTGGPTTFTMTVRLIPVTSADLGRANAYLDSITPNTVSESIRTVTSPNGEASWVDNVNVTSTEKYDPSFEMPASMSDVYAIFNTGSTPRETPVEFFTGGIGPELPFSSAGINNYVHTYPSALGGTGADVINGVSFVPSDYGEDNNILSAFSYPPFFLLDNNKSQHIKEGYEIEIKWGVPNNRNGMIRMQQNGSWNSSYIKNSEYWLDSITSNGDGTSINMKVTRFPYNYDNSATTIINGNPYQFVGNHLLIDVEDENGVYDGTTNARALRGLQAPVFIEYARVHKKPTDIIKNSVTQYPNIYLQPRNSAVVSQGPHGIALNTTNGGYYMPFTKLDSYLNTLNKQQVTTWNENSVYTLAISTLVKPNALVSDNVIFSNDSQTFESRTIFSAGYKSRAAVTITLTLDYDTWILSFYAGQTYYNFLANHLGRRRHELIRVKSRNISAGNWMMMSVIFVDTKVYLYEGDTLIYANNHDGRITSTWWQFLPSHVATTYDFSIGEYPVAEKNFNGEISNFFMASPAPSIEDLVQIHTASTNSAISLKLNDGLKESYTISPLFADCVFYLDGSIDPTNSSAVRTGKSMVSYLLPTTTASDNWSYRIIEIATFDPTHADFYNNVCTVTWSQPSIENQHQGFYFEYDSGKNVTSQNGPRWWWYSGNRKLYQYGNQTGTHTLETPDDFLLSNTHSFQFISDTEYTWTTDLLGTVTSNTNLGGGFTFSSKSKIRLMYATNQSYTKPHTLQVSHSHSQGGNFTQQQTFDIPLYTYITKSPPINPITVSSPYGPALDLSLQTPFVTKELPFVSYLPYDYRGYSQNYLSFSLYFKLNTIPTGQAQLFSVSDLAAPYLGLRVGIESNKYWVHQDHRGNDINSYELPFSFPTNTWIQLTVMLEGTIAKFYHSDVLVAYIPAIITASNGHYWWQHFPLKIGDDTGTKPLDGEIASFHVFDHGKERNKNINGFVSIQQVKTGQPTPDVDSSYSLYNDYSSLTANEIYSFTETETYPKTYTSTEFTSVLIDFDKDFELRLSYTQYERTWTDVFTLRRSDNTSGQYIYIGNYHHNITIRRGSNALDEYLDSHTLPYTRKYLSIYYHSSTKEMHIRLKDESEFTSYSDLLNEHPYLVYHGHNFEPQGGQVSYDVCLAKPHDLSTSRIWKGLIHEVKIISYAT